MPEEFCVIQQWIAEDGDPIRDKPNSMNVDVFKNGETASEQMGGVIIDIEILDDSRTVFDERGLNPENYITIGGNGKYLSDPPKDYDMAISVKKFEGRSVNAVTTDINVHVVPEFPHWFIFASFTTITLSIILMSRFKMKVL